ncbi:SDR family NAD(P)-dependent oxidoreductase [Verminephrobacter eiseniae]|uniref:Short-chain dehydrogenase/reductase SDR n=3 Tax=Verminephrobacter eiseniae TaxID=364317 RepID=A1WJ28_VEREI|nr:SDR family NAD(P)-dependent oxidoreductase [Verminephrobacter eiseniae]ABM57635.1 short-chain dehydrogenase/reductase SDR [Verminephrobacter eiseniae EF01-2]MCW5283255.1 SDR family oxidoreductase [Verminephrobacter eiseniae]MCW5303571.1 SDR family oxidoreductase [Verminephrobacter eiseniae]MCW8188365.1 SDR family oxidoreductase [Verminephrobacter eiseniae]
MDFGIADKKALVTGAARGIGRAEAQALAAEGVALAINDIDAAAALACAEALRQCGARAVACAGDVATPEGARQVVQAALEQLGGLHILVSRHRSDVVGCAQPSERSARRIAQPIPSVLASDATPRCASMASADRQMIGDATPVNNAGAGGQHLGRSVQEMPIEDWDIIVQTHLRSSFLCSKFALPALRASGFGRIVNTSSMNVTGGGRPGVGNYSAAKAGVIGLTRTLAKEVGAAGITVNAIAPGYVETALIAGFSPAKRAVVTGQNPLGRFCRPDEVGALVAFLCSVQAAYINGALICMDGGKRDFFWADT